MDTTDFTGAERKQSKTRSTGTLHTSAKALLTSVAIWIWIRNSVSLIQIAT